MTMAQVTQLIHDYLRHNKKFPHVYCAGCGHGIVLGSLIRSVHGLGYSKDDVVLVAGIGCSGRMAVYVDFNTVHTTHGRALTFATGIKMANPALKVIVAQTDQGRGILGVIDGFASKGVETDEDKAKRTKFLRMIGYKF